MDPPNPRIENLEIEQDIDYQRREWAVQRAGWTIIALVIAAAMLGLMGDGPLSRTEVASADGSMRLEYERFARVGDTNFLRLRFRPVIDPEGRYRLWLEGEYQEATRVREASPTPERSEDDQGRVVYVFRSYEPERSTEVTFYVQPRRPGLRSGRVGVVGGTFVDFRQFIYP